MTHDELDHLHTERQEASAALLGYGRHPAPSHRERAQEEIRATAPEVDPRDEVDGRDR